MPMANHGLDTQIAIYRGGNRVPAGALPPERLPDGRWPVSVEEWRERARATLADGPWGYVEGGAGAEDTMRANREAFQRWRLRPRVLRDVERRSLEVELFGRRLPAPLILAPVGVQSIVHPDAERAPARAAAAAGIPFVNSTVSSLPLEEVAACMGGAPKWFQLYPARNRDVMASMIERAQAAGYEALVVTLDTTMLGWRERDLRLGYLPFLEAAGVANYFTDPAFRALLPRPPAEDPQAAVLTFLAVYVNPGFTWDDLAFIRQRTRVPLLLKGITHADDAARAVAEGVDGIIVSNHGGRQVDGAVAALDALPEVCAVVAGRVPVLFDSGVRRAADVLKALALGARAVLVGRPYIYALAVAGEAGVGLVIRNLMAELDLTLGLCGLASVQDVDRDLVREVRP
jgi:lactate 2-monooxygenase